MEAELTDPDQNPDDRLGFSVAISNGRAIVGIVGDDDNGDASGSALVYRQSGSNWYRAERLYNSDAAVGDSFGCSVATSAGDPAVVGAYEQAALQTGAAYVFNERAIPAVSEWGLVVMALLGLTVGTIMFSRMKRQTA